MSTPAELLFLPKYNTYKFKVKTKLNEKNELALISIGSYDNNNLILETNETEKQQFILGHLPESTKFGSEPHVTFLLVLRLDREPIGTVH